MKRISIFLAAAVLTVPVFSRGQDAATEERLNKLGAQIQDLVDAKDAQNKRLDELAKQIRELEEKADKPSGNYASAEDVKQLAAKLNEVNESRVHDNEVIVKKIEALGKTLGSTSSIKRSTTATVDRATDHPTAAIPDKGIEYEVKPGDTLSGIAKACKDQNIKVTVQQILDANPGLKAENLRVGKKIFIPATPQ
jgi:LysM repeat protein